MTISEFGSLGEFLGSVLTLATLAYLAVQIRQNTAQQKREELISIQPGQNSVVAALVCGSERGQGGQNHCRPATIDATGESQFASSPPP